MPRNQGFPGGSECKNPPACISGDPDPISGSERSPGEGNGNPLQYSCLENSTDRGGWWTTVRGVAESDVTERLMHWMRGHPGGLSVSTGRALGAAASSSTLFLPMVMADSHQWWRSAHEKGLGMPSCIAWLFLTTVLCGVSQRQLILFL